MRFAGLAALDVAQTLRAYFSMFLFVIISDLKLSTTTTTTTTTTMGRMRKRDCNREK
jgi:hypothetical protein